MLMAYLYVIWLLDLLAKILLTNSHYSTVIITNLFEDEQLSLFTSETRCFLYHSNHFEKSPLCLGRNFVELFYFCSVHLLLCAHYKQAGLFWEISCSATDFT